MVVAWVIEVRSDVSCGRSLGFRVLVVLVSLESLKEFGEKGSVHVSMKAVPEGMRRFLIAKLPVVGAWIFGIINC